ncbi:MAG: nicotinic acid mononucleotide adenylyltransferase, partial [Nitrospirae bacterium]
MTHKKAYLGGTFNPIHYGHLRMAEEVREALGLEKVVFVLSCNPPLKEEDVLPAELRLQMVELAIRDNPFFEVSDIECHREG